MRAFIDHGMSADQAANALEFSFAADADVHLTIAKLRAARRVWARVAEAFGCSAASARHAHLRHHQLAHADRARRLDQSDPQRLRRPWGRGGRRGFHHRAPVQRTSGRGDALRPRVGRNLQIMLMEESHLGVTADPAGGGYLHETLGHRLAQAGWACSRRSSAAAACLKRSRRAGSRTKIAKVRDSAMAQYAEGRKA
jgi:methylmalonyl-CoA mutase